MAMSSLSESETDNDDDDNDDSCDVSSNLIDEAADLSLFRCKSPLPNFEDILAEEESLLSYDVTNLSDRSLTTASYTCASMPASSSSLSPSTLEQGQQFDKGPNLTMMVQSVGVDADPFVKEQETALHH